MSGLAVICRQRDMTVTGSDVTEKFITDKILAQASIEVFEEFDSKNLDWGPDLVVIGTSWGADNPEVKLVQEKNILHITDSELRGLLSAEKRTIAVTGVHGKTTTTALMAFVFGSAGLAPSFLIGTGTVPGLSSNAAWGQGKNFIVEGDEYSRSVQDHQPKFLDLKPVISIITSLEWEHVDVYKNLAAIENVFSQLVEKTEELVIACGDWPSVKKIIVGQEDKVATYGFGFDNLWQAYDVRQEFDGTIFKVKKEGVEVGEFEIKLFGRHNVLNALAVIIAGLKEGIKIDQIQSGLKNFTGAERRFDVSEKDGIIFVDDYGHHPSEIKTTLEAVRHRYPEKIIYCVFQPHMASRTKALLEGFAQSFAAVDKVVLADIFASAREKAEAITSKDLAMAIKKYHQDVVYAGDLNQTIEYLQNLIKPGMVLVTMGAGDVYRVRDKFLAKM